MNGGTPSFRRLMNLGRLSSAALMLSGLAGVVAPMTVASALDLQPGDSLREFLLETHLQQIRTLVKHQDKGGLWHTLIDDPGSYLEASATAGFAYGILKS